MDFLKRQQGGKVMKDSELRMIETMLKKQDELNSAIMKEFGLTTISKEQIDMATLDEIGEFTHELKGDWCWWKKTQPQVDEEKVLGELVDVWHFVLSYQNHFINGEKGIEYTCTFKRNSKNILSLMRNHKFGLTVAFSDLVSWKWDKLERLTAITEYLGFTIEDVYQAYCGKNKINYQRLKEGY
jgi:dimeric dUTPase (all-alpha-NTP-PPase superfamily)